MKRTGFITHKCLSAASHILYNKQIRVFSMPCMFSVVELKASKLYNTQSLCTVKLLTLALQSFYRLS